MIDFSFKSSTEIVFGKNTEEKSGELIKKYGGKKTLIHHSGESFVSNLIDKIKLFLKKAGVEYVELSGVVPNPRLSLVYKGIELCKKEGVDSILAVGGGSVMDSAKGIALGAVYDGDVWDLYSKKAFPERILPVGCIVTFPGTGSEASWATVITKEDEGLKRSIDNDINRPKFAILNPEITYTLPSFQTAAGILDAITHVMERYFTNTKYTDFTDELSYAIIRSAIRNAPIVLDDPKDYPARSEIMLMALFAQNNLTGMGREQDWASHLIEHEISTKWDIAHGAGLSIIMPAWMKYVYRHDVNLFAKFAVNVFNIPYDFDFPERTALKGIQMFEEFCHYTLKLPVRLSELNAICNTGEINDEVLKKLAANIYYNDEHTLGNFVRLTEEDCFKIYKSCI